MMDLYVAAKSDDARAAAALAGPLRFGQTFADVMMTAHHTRERGWHDLSAVAFGPLPMSPAAKALHYGLEVFEGHKAYAWDDGRVALFRPDCNAERLNRSASRLGMPSVPVEMQRLATDRLVDLLRAWVPTDLGASLYLRPMLIATEPTLGAVPSSSHLYAILACPTGPLFAGGEGAISVLVDDMRPRAVPGGVGAAKTGGNYAAGMQAKCLAKEAGFDEVMFLDAIDHRKIEELSGMNVFAVEGGKRLVTPPAHGTILEGITRRSVIELAGELGLEAEERPLVLSDVLDGVHDGRVTELLAVGTAAVVTPIGRVSYAGTDHVIGDGGAGPVAVQVRDTLTGIQHGRIEDERGWMRVVPHAAS